MLLEGNSVIFASETSIIHLTRNFNGILLHGFHPVSQWAVQINLSKGFGCRILLPLLGMVLLKRVMQIFRMHCCGRTGTFIIFMCLLYADIFIYALKMHFRNSATKIWIYVSISFICIKHACMQSRFCIKISQYIIFANISHTCKSYHYKSPPIF